MLETAVFEFVQQFIMLQNLVM